MSSKFISLWDYTQVDIVSLCRYMRSQPNYKALIGQIKDAPDTLAVYGQFCVSVSELVEDHHRQYPNHWILDKSKRSHIITGDTWAITDLFFASLGKKTQRSNILTRYPDFIKPL